MPTVEWFQYYWTGNVASAAPVTLFLNSGGLSGRFATMADTWQFYRIVALTAHMLPTCGTNLAASDQCALAYIPEYVDTYPASMFDCLEILKSQVITGLDSMPKKLSLNRFDLLGANSLKWWKSIAGVPDDWEERQGSLRIVNTNAANSGIKVLIVFKAEFTGSLATANTPMWDMFRTWTQSKKPISREEFKALLELADLRGTPKPMAFAMGGQHYLLEAPPSSSSGTK